MKRNIISIDKSKCIGCGGCINACHQGALKLVDGKAELISESYCDGLGRCLPKCPAEALTVIEKEIVESSKSIKKGNNTLEKKAKMPCACPSAHSKQLKRDKVQENHQEVRELQSELRQWPCQIQLVPVNAPYFDGAKLLIAADCTAFANANIHTQFMKGKITLIGCPKLDEVDYAEKLSEIISNNDIKSVDVIRMSVPCCRGIENAVKQALIDSGKMIPWGITVISTDGEIIE